MIKVKFPTRRNTYIKIQGKLPLWDTLKEEIHWVPLELWLTRATIDDNCPITITSKLIAIELLQHALGENLEKNYKAVYSFKIGSQLGRMRLLRKDLYLLRKDFSSAERSVNAYSQKIAFFLLLPAYNSCPIPRGRIKKGWPIRSHIPFLLVTAREVVLESAGGNREIQVRLKKILNEPEVAKALDYLVTFDLTESHYQQALSIILVDRALRGGWEKYKVPSIATLENLADPNDVYRRYVYGKHRSIKQALNIMKTAPWKAEAMERLINILLGPPGIIFDFPSFSDQLDKISW